MINKTRVFTRHWLVFALLFFSVFLSPHGSAQMISNTEILQIQKQEYSKIQLQSALRSSQLKNQLQELGVDPTQLEDRVARLTPKEIDQLNNELKDNPAGSGIVGALVFVFVVFIFTDMLCATDIFNFVKCIN